MAFRTASGRFQLRIHAGVAALLNRADGYFERENGPAPELGGCYFRGIPAALPYVGVTPGATFDF